jgi:hypothetical protein
MRSSIIRIEHDESHAGVGGDALNAFVRDLSSLSRKHGIAIAGDPTLYVMEADDRSYDYSVDDRSRLILGSAK